MEIYVQQLEKFFVTVSMRKRKAQYPIITSKGSQAVQIYLGKSIAGSVIQNLSRNNSFDNYNSSCEIKPALDKEAM